MPSSEETLIEYLKRVEGYHPYEGYGRNPPSRTPISKQQAEAHLLEDVRAARQHARRRIDMRYGQGTFDTLDPNRQSMLTDFAFNIGPAFSDEFPRFTESVVRGDLARAAQESRRTAFGGKPLTGRNRAFLETFLPGYSRYAR